MTSKNFLDAHQSSRAFVANLLDRVANLISRQGEQLLQEAGLAFPARALSTVLLIGERGGASVTDIAGVLEQPHQLVMQRVALLISSGTIERAADPDDKRRKVLRLTAQGVGEFERLQVVLAQADQAFAALFDEIECDLQSVLIRTSNALNRSPILERIQSLSDST